MPESLFLTPQRRAIQWATMLAQLPAPTADEQVQLTHYARGLPTAAEPLQHILYCSQATHPFEERHLNDLLEQARANNRRSAVTGLLCYEAGRFVQLIEGPPATVTQLFACIERDPRHQQVRVLSTGLGPLRQFADWRLVAAGTHPAEFYWLTTYLEAHRHRLVLPQVPIPEPELLSQLELFSRAGAGPPGDASAMDALVQPDGLAQGPAHSSPLAAQTRLLAHKPPR